MKSSLIQPNYIAWVARVLSIIFALFISIFAMDIFSEHRSFFETIVGLLIHLIPTFLIVFILVLAWKREWIGSISYFILGILYIIWTWKRFPLSTYFIISGPLFLVSILFEIAWIKKRKSL